MRLFSPLSASRLVALLLGISICLPAGVAAQTKTTRKAPAKTTAVKKPAAKSYSASSSSARKARPVAGGRAPAPPRAHAPLPADRDRLAGPSSAR